MNVILRASIITIVMVCLVVGTATDSARASQELAKEQVVSLGLTAGDIGTLDPIGGLLVQDRAPMHHIFGALVRHPVGDCSSRDFQPDLATKWEMSSDKLTWTFHLRKGVKWHWGYGEVTSEDVIYSLNRVKNSNVSAYRSAYDNFKEIKAIDRYTVQVTTAKPEAFFLNKVANYYGGWIACKKALEKGGAFDRRMSPKKEEVVGTGPFKFLEYKPKDRITLVRNDDYWEAKPVVEMLIFRYIPDDGVREIALLKGEIAGFRGVYDYKWLQHMKSKGIVIEPTGPMDLKALYFNLRVKPFDDRRVREAFAYGTNQDSIINMQGKEISNYCTSPVPSGMYGHIDAGWAKYKRDPEKAKKLLAESGYPEGLTVKLFMTINDAYLTKVIVSQSELKECGINLEMTKIDHTGYLTKARQGLNPLVIYGAVLPLATSWLRDIYHSNSMIGSPKAANNFMYYSKPEVDRLIELAEVSFDEKARLDALAKAQRIIVEDLPAIGVVETRIPLLRNPWFDLAYEPKSNFLWNYEVGLKTKILKH